MSPLQHAQLIWDQEGHPLSHEFADIYFSRLSGLDESRYVFLQHNQLAQRFAQLSPGKLFVIGETGFGTGLNFLATWQLFLQQAPQDARLHFISSEKFPIRKKDLQQALALWPELQTLSQHLLQHYLVIQPGFQNLFFADGRIRLTLLIGDATEQFQQLDAQVDAWFLDGFAPAKNPEMWSEALFEQLARLSHPGTTLATFTSAGFVRRGLQAAGFRMQRTTGFGCKREMLYGQLEKQNPAPWRAPWLARPPSGHNTQKAVVIGAGIAGCATAFSLAQRGWSVTLIERHNHIGQEASGNPQGVLYLKLSASHTPLSQWILSGFGYSRRLLEHWSDSPHWQACGVLQLAYSDDEAQRLQGLTQTFNSNLLQSVTAQQASQLAGVTLTQSGLFYPEAGWLKPPELCRLLIMHKNIQLMTAVQAERLEYRHAQWHILDEQNTVLAKAPVVIIASGNNAKHFTQASHLPIKPIRGQVSSIPATTASHALKAVVTAKGYVSPVHQKQHCVGASFNFHGTNTALSTEDHQGNLQRLRDLSEALYQALNTETLAPSALNGHAALRCTSPDYLPLIGPIAAADSLNDSYSLLGKDSKAHLNQDCAWHPGLFVNIAHGSRGLITAPLAGELLAALINNEPLPLPKPLVDACHPNRFAIKAIIRRQT